MITKQVKRRCSICGRPLLISINLKTRSYKGGHYFGKIPLYRKSDLRSAKQKFNKKYGWWVLEDIKPYGHREYWECDKCFA